MATTAYNNIITNLGNSLANSTNTPFTGRNFADQLLNEDVKQCAKDNLLSDCENPPSIAQLDFDIQKADSILEDLLLNDRFDRETLIFMFEVAIKFLKIKKCIAGQYPCFAHETYLTNKAYIDNFVFSS